MKNFCTILFVLSLAACTPEPRLENTPAARADVNTVMLTSEQLKNGGIVTGYAERKNLTRAIQVSGSIEAPPGNIISVSFPFGGYVRRMNLLPGTQVKRGEILATLEDPQYIQLQQDYLTAKNRLSFLASEHSRQKELNADKTTSDKSYQQVKEEYESQHILVRALQEKLKLININPETLTTAALSGSVKIYSPINGYVTDVFVNTGRYVSPTDVLFELVDPSDVHLILNVYEKDINAIAVGQEVTCYIGNQPEKKYSAKVHLISKSVKADRTGEVHCDFTRGTALNFLPGMFVNAQVELTNQPVWAVPDDAVVRWANTLYVFIETAANSFEMIPVTTGLQANGFTEIKTDLAQHKVVVKNAYTLLMKLKSSDED